MSVHDSPKKALQNVVTVNNILRVLHLMTTSSNNQLPTTGFVRLWQIIGDKKRNIPAALPISRSAFLNGIKSGKYPKPIKLGARTNAWRVSEIRALLEKLGA